MRPLEADVLQFVHDQFQPESFDQVIELLRTEPLSMPRVQRAVLYLSGGSLPMLRHYAELAERDVAQLLERAEYVLDVSQTPLDVRDFVQPLKPCTAVTGSAGPMPRRRAAPARAPARKQRRFRLHAEQIRGASFYLGVARYVVIGEPGDDLLVPCVRRYENVITLMHLPLMFVVEHISEHIELADVSG